METSQIVFLIVGIFFLLLTLLSSVWVMRSIKNKCTENELKTYGWFKKWIYGNKASFLMLLTIVLAGTGISLISLAFGTPIV